MQRDIEFSVGEFYHLYTRGVERRELFLDDDDRKRFITLLRVCNGDKPVVFKIVRGLPLDEVDVGESLVAIGAYCLMPNHVHILVREIREQGISRFAEKLFTAYSMYFNRRYDRKGRLYESVFQARHVQSDEYLKYLYAYIHLNPVKLVEPDWKETGISDRLAARRFLESYTVSSFQDFRHYNRKEKIILSPKHFPEYFKKRFEFDDFINDWLNFRGLPLA